MTDFLESQREKVDEQCLQLLNRLERKSSFSESDKDACLSLAELMAQLLLFDPDVPAVMKEKVVSMLSEARAEVKNRKNRKRKNRKRKK